MYSSRKAILSLADIQAVTSIQSIKKQVGLKLDSLMCRSVHTSRGTTKLPSSSSSSSSSLITRSTGVLSKRVSSTPFSTLCSSSSTVLRSSISSGSKGANRGFSSASSSSASSLSGHSSQRPVLGVVLGLTTVAVTTVGIVNRSNVVSAEDSETEEAEEESGSGGLIEGAKQWFTGFVKSYTEPSAELLLPDPDPEPYQKRMTLVISLEDLLIYNEWTPENGWRTKKRNGVGYFLAKLREHYEIVLFTSQTFLTAQMIVQQLDQDGSIRYHLYRDATT
eukprot:TRINITY_DN738_c0_g2_i1.p1 TRINITY_DN738_c0_g2~~TRINITY_DN738_c0_g2_i1.p1  ORF type:complete len:292 (+),score=74.18 TRINITY_DN738_c0_g2_i1:44-877(+)